MSHASAASDAGMPGATAVRPGATTSPSRASIAAAALATPRTRPPGSSACRRSADERDDPPAGPWTSAAALRDAIARRETFGARGLPGRARPASGAANRQLHAFISVSGERALARADALDRGPRAPARCTACRSRSRTTSPSPACARPPGRRCSTTTSPPSTRRSPRDSKRRAPSSSARRCATSSRWGRRRRIARSGPSHNPWALDRAPGGTSGGSTAAVAAGLRARSRSDRTPADSIRQPAAFCGVVGLKPTYGRVSRYGLIAFASSLDQIGPIARTTDDAALMLDVISGADPRDANGRGTPRRRLVRRLPRRSIAGLRDRRATASAGIGRRAGRQARFDDALARSGASARASRRSNCRTAPRHRRLLHRRHGRSEREPGAV